jgi:hypothetical protein
VFKAFGPRGKYQRAEQSVVNQIMMFCLSVPNYMVIRQKNVGSIFTDPRTGSPRFGRDKFRQPGVADLLVLHRGKHFAIEAKTASGKQSADQKAWGDRWTACGGVYLVCRKFEDFQAAMNKFQA